MKLKSKPEDFIVEEIIALSLNAESGKYKIYKLTKTSIDTHQAIDQLANASHVPTNSIGISGLKDKHAKTIQYISVDASKALAEVKQKNITCEFVGFSNTPITLGSHKSNKFTLTIRNLFSGKIDEIKKRFEHVFVHTLPNYYDSQRFGSVLDGEFIGIHVLNKDFIKALEIYCTTIRPSDLAFIKADKRALLAAWPGVMDVHVKDKVLKNIVITLGKTQDFKSAYEQIPEFERKMHMQAVASYVWNEALKVDLKVARLYKPFSVPYAAGSLLFGDIKGTMATTVSSTAMDVVIKESNTPAAVMEWIDVERESMITVSKGSILDVSDDELAKSKGLQKLTVTFELPTGSYATIVVKNVFRS